MSIFRGAARRLLAHAPVHPPARFLIVCPPRTGSELLVDLLDDHPRIRCEGEILDPPVARPLEHLSGKAVLAKLRGAQAWGCKILDQQLRWYEDRFGGASDFFREAVAHDWRLVHLTREDLLAQALSGLRADRVGHHHRTGDVTSFAPMPVDPVALIAWMHVAEQNASWLDDAVAPFPRVQLEYGRDLRDPPAQQRTVDAICTALGVAPAAVRSDLTRITPPDVEDSVTNWSEVRDVLACTRFRSYLPAS